MGLGCLSGNSRAEAAWGEQTAGGGLGSRGATLQGRQSPLPGPVKKKSQRQPPLSAFEREQCRPVCERGVRQEELFREALRAAEIAAVPATVWLHLEIPV